jgi:hypothetical protein
MNRINTDTSLTNFDLYHVLDNNETVYFKFYYVDDFVSWYYDMTYQDFSINGNKILLGFDLLSQYKNILPFTLACTSSQDIENPSFEDSFFSGQYNMYTLTREEAGEVNDFVNAV